MLLRVFLLGGTGAIGGHALAALVGAGHAVSALARTAEKAAAVRAQGADPVAVSIASFDFVDVNEPGITAGDYFLQANTLTVQGQAPGTDLLRCTASGDQEHPGICDVVITLEDGTITAAGELPKFEPIDGLPFVLAITGGTGAYAGAAGDASVIERSGGYEAILTLLPPG